MNKLVRTVTLALALTALSLAAVSAAEKITCIACGMMVDRESKFCARIVRGDDALYFCDIGDMFTHVNRKGAKDVRVEVKDFISGEWTEARKAFFVRSVNKFKTPMGWSLAAFKDRNAAAKYGSPMDFDAAAKALK